MVDIFALVVSHGLIALAVWRLLSRPDLDEDGAQPPQPAPAPKQARASATHKAQRPRRTMIVPGAARDDTDGDEAGPGSGPGPRNGRDA